MRVHGARFILAKRTRRAERTKGGPKGLGRLAEPLHPSPRFCFRRRAPYGFCMTNPRPALLLPVILILTCVVAFAGIPRRAHAQSCDVAGEEAERRHELPSGLLRAIGRVESGRRDPGTGKIAPWPWTINAEGRGKLFESLEEALAGTRALQQARVASIDVGCFQINLVHHPLAFTTLEEGFDPIRNADYAARFLQQLRTKTGNWDSAVAAYHSATPERGAPYREKVMASLAQGGIAAPAAPAVPAAPAPFVVRMVTWNATMGAPQAGGMRVWTPSAQGQGAAVIRLTRG